MPKDRMTQVVLKPGHRKGPQTQEEEAFADEFLKMLTDQRVRKYKAETNDWDLENLPLPPRPPGFRDATLGPVNLGNDPWQQMKDMVPQVEGLVPRVRFGPSAGVIQTGLDDLGEIISMDGTNLGGAYDLTDSERSHVSLQPNLWRRNQAFPILAHELTHAAGFKQEGKGSQVYKMEKAADHIANPPKFGSEHTFEDAIASLQEALNNMGAKTTVKRGR